MLCKDIGKSIVYILAPLDVIAILWIRKPWEQGELQMIMGVDQAGHNQEFAQIDF
jgi:hypothetical protein